MTMLDSPTDAVAPTEGLSFDRTVSRRLVQRDGLQEVFLTDFRARFDGRFTAGARLPRAHPYYNDHLQEPRLHDPLVILESVRQALLCAVRMHPDAPRDAVALTLATRLEIGAPGALARGRDLDDLELHGREQRGWSRSGVLSRVVHRVHLVLGGAELGSVTTDTALRTPVAHRRLRLLGRPTPPPSSDQLLARERASAVAPYLLGRQRPENVLLLEPEFAGGGLTARVRMPFSHPSHFDRRQDHLPEAVLLEAARQAALLLVGEEFGRSPARSVLLGLAAEHRRFAELDADLALRASFVPRPGAAGGLPVSVEFVQRGAVIGAVSLRLAGTERIGR